MKNERRIPNTPEIRRRLREAQETVCPNGQKRFAEQAGFSDTGYRKIIDGKNASVKKTTIEMLCEKNGINTEWVLYEKGDMLAKKDGLTGNVYIDNIIREIEKLHPLEQKRIYNLLMSVIGEKGRAELALSIAMLIDDATPDAIESIKQKIVESALINKK